MFSKLSQLIIFIGDYLEYIVDIIIAASSVERFLLIIATILLARWE